MTKISIIKRVLIIAILTLSATIVACIVSVFAFPNDTQLTDLPIAEQGGLSVTANNDIWYSSGFIYINSLEGLGTMRNWVNAGEMVTVNGANGKLNPTTASYKLMADIVINDIWNPIGKAGSTSSDHGTSFCGTFDGNGYTITMKKYEFNGGATENYVRVGLFSRVHGATIKNLYLEIDQLSTPFNNTWQALDTLSRAYKYYGGLVGFASETTISYCYIDWLGENKTFNAPGFADYIYFGGLAGRLDGGKVDNCVVDFWEKKIQFNYATDCWTFPFTFGGICGDLNDNVQLSNNVLLFNNVNIEFLAYNSRCTSCSFYVIGEGSYTTTKVVTAGLNGSFKKHLMALTISEPSTGGAGSSSYQEEITYPSINKGASVQYNSNGWNNYIDKFVNGGANFANIPGEFLNKWYPNKDQDIPIQGWFARVKIVIHNVWQDNSNGGSIPKYSIDNYAVRLNRTNSWADIYNYHNGTQRFAQKSGYEFKGFSTTNLGSDVSYDSCYRIQGSNFDDIIKCDNFAKTNVTSLGSYDTTNKCHNLYAVWELSKYAVNIRTCNFKEVTGYNSEQILLSAYGYGNSSNELLYDLLNNDETIAIGELNKDNIENKALELLSKVGVDKSLYNIEFVNSKGGEQEYPTLPIFEDVEIYVKYVPKYVEVLQFEIYPPDGSGNFEKINVYKNDNGQYVYSPSTYDDTLDDDTLNLETLSKVLKKWYNSETYRVVGFTVKDYLTTEDGKMLAEDKIPKRFKYDGSNLYTVYNNDTEKKISNSSINMLNSLEDEIYSYGEDQSYLTLEMTKKYTISASGTDKTWQTYTSLKIDAPDVDYMTAPIIKIYPIIVSDTYSVHYKNEKTGDETTEEYTSLEGKSISAGDSLVGWILDVSEYSNCTITMGTTITIKSDAINIELSATKKGDDDYYLVTGIKKESYGDVYLKAVNKGKIVIDWDLGYVLE